MRGNVLDQADAGFATTLARGLAVLEAFAPDVPLLGNTAIAERIGLTRPTVARLTSTLADLGYLKYDERAAKYRLGARVLTLAHPLLASLRLRQIARPLMQDFAASLRGVVSIGVMDGLRVIHLECARSGEHETHVPDIGSSLPLLRSAMGRAVFSMLPLEEAVRVETSLAAADATGWAAFRARFQDGVTQCRTRGYCVALGDFLPDLHGAGAPLYRTGGDYLALNCSLSAFRLRPGELESDIGPRLLSLARSLRTLMEQPQP